MVANNTLSSGQIAADLKLRDQTLVQAQTQVDQLAASMSSALVGSNDGRHRRHRTAGGLQRRYVEHVAGNTINLTITNSGNNTQQQISIVNVTDPTALPLQNLPNANPKLVGVNMSGGMASIVSQLNAALGPGVVFSGSGTTLSMVGSASRERQRGFDDHDGDGAGKWQSRNWRCLPTATRPIPARSPAPARR